MALRALFIGSTVLTLFGSFSLIGMGIYEMHLDQLEHGTSFTVTHIFISLSIFCCSNIMILAHVLYITQYVLRGLRYKWHLSFHYFTYILLEIVSVVCIIGKYEYLEYPLVLHLLTGVLAVFLFFFNCWAVEIFKRLEDRIKAEQEERNLRVDASGKPRKIPCVQINLRGPLLDPNTSSAYK